MIGSSLNQKGFSLFEMLIVVAIIGVIALAAVPVAELSFVRSLEVDLQENLDCISFLGRNNVKLTKLNIPESELYPRQLIHLVKPDPLGVPIHDRAGNIVQDKYGNDVYFKSQPYLARIPVDPFVGDAIWAIHCASNGKVATYPAQAFSGNPADLLSGTGTYDVSVATLTPADRKGFIISISGTDYRDW
jgi:prepilin-type N-terminal cleavage/methylation domain-containing protein